MTHAVARERRRLLRAVRELRTKWRRRMDDSPILVEGALTFEGAARAVQALDEALRAMRAPKAGS